VAQLVPGAGRVAGDRFDCLVDDSPVRDFNITEWMDLIRTTESANVGTVTELKKGA